MEWLAEGRRQEEQFTAVGSVKCANNFIQLLSVLLLLLLLIDIRGKMLQCQQQQTATTQLEDNRTEIANEVVAVAAVVAYYQTLHLLPATME